MSELNYFFCNKISMGIPISGYWFVSLNNFHLKYCFLQKSVYVIKFTLITSGRTPNVLKVKCILWCSRVHSPLVFTTSITWSTPVMKVYKMKFPRSNIDKQLNFKPRKELKTLPLLELLNEYSCYATNTVVKTLGFSFLYPLFLYK